jgi:hypothetical protein
MLKRLAAAAGLSALFTVAGVAQEADFGLSMPVMTASFGAMDTHRLDYFSSAPSPMSANFRLMF